MSRRAERGFVISSLEMNVALPGSVAVLLLVWACCAAPLAWGTDVAVPQAVLDAETQRVELIAKVAPTVLAIFSSSGGGGGSGVVISPDGYALTNFHVAQPCGPAMKCGMADGRVYDAVIVGVDPVGDVALIKLVGRDDFPHATLGDSDQVRAGDWVYVVGNPFLLATDFQPTVTYGIISGTNRYQYPAGTLLEYADCLQTDASINPGNSGGPLFDAQGRLIGINGRGSFEKRGRVNVGVGYAISINQIKNFLGHLRSGRIVDHATLGAVVALDARGKVVVSDILEDSDAYRRGLRYDDEIVSFAGRPITTPNGFKNALGIYPRGWRVPLSFRRDGKRSDIVVRLAGVHDPAELIRKAEGRPEMPAVPQPKQPPGGPPDETPKPAPGDPIPIPSPDPEKHRLPGGALGEAPLPKELEPLVQEKRGYANYHFNLVERDRVLAAWAQRSGLNETESWSIAGRLLEGRQFQMAIDAKGVLLELPSGDVGWEVSEDLASSLVPEGSGGMLMALHFWRRLAVDGAGKFGEVYYEGTAPVVGRPELADVLVGNRGGVETRFFFDAATGDLLALEAYSAEDVDPCELLWGDYREVDGRWLPHTLEVRHGDQRFTQLALETFTFPTRAAGEGEP